MKKDRLYQAYCDHGYGSRTYSDSVYDDEDQCYEEAKSEFRGYSGGEIHVTWITLVKKEQDEG